MSSRTLQDLTHRMVKALDLPSPPDINIDPILRLVASISEQKFVGYFTRTFTGEVHSVAYAPKGKVWKLISALIYITRDSTVGDLTYHGQMWHSPSGKAAIELFSEVLSADETTGWAIGPGAPSADAAAYSFCQADLRITENIGLDVYISAPEAGDTVEIRLTFEETLNVPT